MLVLDTNTVIALLRPNPAYRARFVLALAAGAAVALPSVVEFELWFGVFHGTRRDQDAANLQSFLATGIETLPFDRKDAQTAAEIRAFLAARGTPIGPYDVLIAAQALRRDATLVTANLGEFRRVPGLQCVNWAR